MDGMSLDLAKELRNSRLWKGVVAELDMRISLKLNELRNCSPEELQLTQRDIAKLEEFKRLPEDVIDRETIPS